MAANIVVKNLSKFYGHKAAIRKLNFSINPGEIVGFIGPNGAGKSTTLRILCGLLPANQGCVYINQRPLTTQGHYLKQIVGYMPENNPLPEDMRVEEFLRFRAQIKHIANVTQSVGEVMERCELRRTAAHKIIRTLSKGFKQRVGIADALLGKPQLIMLDEPTIGLDPQQILSIRGLIKQLQGETTVIFSSHILPEIEAACSQLLIIHQGELVANGSSTQLRRKYFPRVRYQLLLAQDDPAFLPLLQQSTFELNCIKTVKQDVGIRFILETQRTSSSFEADLNAWLFGHGFRVQQFFRMEPNLEDLFLKLTKFSWKKTTPIL